MKIKGIVTLLVLLFPVLGHSQTDIQMSQHIFNRSLYNPASIDISGDINVYGHWRDQWQTWGGIRTISTSANVYVPSCKFGFGIMIFKDQLGLEHDVQCKLTYSYHVFLNDEKARLSLGLSAGLVDKTIKWSDAVVQEPGNTVPTELESKWKADFDFGLEYNTERFQAGFSVKHLNKRANNAHNIDFGQHFYGYLRYNFPRQNNVSFSATVFAQNSKKSTHIESNAILFYRSRMWIGAGYRCDEKLESESIVAMVGLNLFSFLRLGYSFDYNIGKIGIHTKNTHEIMLKIKIARLR